MRTALMGPTSSAGVTVPGTLSTRTSFRPTISCRPTWRAADALTCREHQISTTGGVVGGSRTHNFHRATVLCQLSDDHPAY